MSRWISVGPRTTWSIREEEKRGGGGGGIDLDIYVRVRSQTLSQTNLSGFSFRPHLQGIKQLSSPRKPLPPCARVHPEK